MTKRKFGENSHNFVVSSLVVQVFLGKSVQNISPKFDKGNCLFSDHNIPRKIKIKEKFMRKIPDKRKLVEVAIWKF